MNNLPTIKNMFKLIVVLLLAMMALSLVLAIVKMLIPLLVVALIVLGGLYLFRQFSEPKRI